MGNIQKAIILKNIGNGQLDQFSYKVKVQSFRYHKVTHKVIITQSLGQGCIAILGFIFFVPKCTRSYLIVPDKKSALLHHRSFDLSLKKCDMIKLTREQFDVPSGIMLQVSGLICEHQLTHEIIEADEDQDTITLEIQYSKQQREAIHQIEDLIADNSDDDGEDHDE